MSDGERGVDRQVTGTWYSGMRAIASARQRASEKEEELDADEVLSIRDPDLLRAVVARRVLAGFGRVLHSSHGSMDTFDLSAPVQWIDTFLSHSWNTPGWLKYLALLYRINGMLAAMVAVLVHVAVHGGELLGWWQLNHMYSLRAYVVDGPRTNEIYIRLHYVFALVAFWLTLLFGQYFPCTGRQGLFLDKVCIHQSDQVKKQAGIQMLGAFLRRSKCMLVLWQPVYFERTWCVFEMAAFLHMNRADEMGSQTNTDIVFLPLKLPLLALGLNLFHTFASIAGGLVGPISLFLKAHMVWVATLTGPWQVVYVFLFAVAFFVGLYAIPALLLWPYVRQHLLDRRTLLEQLRKFTFEDTKCFSPDDRTFVRSKVEEWFGSTEEFDTYVRDLLTRRLRSTLFRHGPIPYRFVLFGSLPHLFLCSSPIAEALRVGDTRMAWQSLVFCASLSTVADAMAMAFVLRLGAATLDSPAAETVWARRLAGPAATAVIFAVPAAVGVASTLLTVPLWAAGVVFALQAATVAYLYQGEKVPLPAPPQTAARGAGLAGKLGGQNLDYVGIDWDLSRDSV